MSLVPVQAKLLKPNEKPIIVVTSDNPVVWQTMGLLHSLEALAQLTGSQMPERVAPEEQPH
jgi:hypothetical protein